MPGTVLLFTQPAIHTADYPFDSVRGTHCFSLHILQRRHLKLNVNDGHYNFNWHAR